LASAHFERLSAMDLSFLAMEDGRARMHIGAVSLYDAAPLRADDGGIDFERIVAFADAQLHKFPRYRQRLEWVPGFAQPVWVDDDRFNLRFHMRHTALPPPGDERDLKRLAGRILSQEFDRSKPLWENWFVDSLTDDRFAVISKVHHCMADGITGVALGNLLVGTSPDYEPPARPEWVPRPAPDATRLVIEELRHRVAAPIRLLRSTRSGAGQGGPETTGTGVRGLLGNVVQSGSSTPLNVEIGPHRRFDWAKLPFDEVRRIGKAADGTVNDVVLAVATGALRDFLQRHDVTVDDLDFRAVVPVNMRGRADAPAAGNRVSEMIAHLPVAEAVFGVDVEGHTRVGLLQLGDLLDRLARGRDGL
jgi:diacylglycerol O-acyltransferase